MTVLNLLRVFNNKLNRTDEYVIALMFTRHVDRWCQMVMQSQLMTHGDMHQVPSIPGLVTVSTLGERKDGPVVRALTCISGDLDSVPCSAPDFPG